MWLSLYFSEDAIAAGERLLLPYKILDINHKMCVHLLLVHPHLFQKTNGLASKNNLLYKTPESDAANGI